MNYLKMLGLVACITGALTIFAVPASATTLTSPAGTTYTGAIKATSGVIELHGSFITVKCESSSFEGNVSQHGSGVTVKIPLSFLRLFPCNFPLTVLSYGNIEWHGTGNGNATVTWNAFELTVETSIANCIFSGNSVDLGTFTGGSPPKFHLFSAGIPRTGHSIFCGSSGVLTGSYTITTPGTLLAD